MKKEKGHPKAAANNHPAYYADLSAAAQRSRFLDALLCGPITTLDARRNLDILMPAARVRELRLEGYRIVTVRTHQETDSGKL